MVVGVTPTTGPIIVVVAAPTKHTGKKVVLTVPGPEGATGSMVPLAVTRVADILATGTVILGLIGPLFRLPTDRVDARQFTRGHIGDDIDRVGQSIVVDCRISGALDRFEFRYLIRPGLEVLGLILDATKTGLQILENRSTGARFLFKLTQQGGQFRSFCTEDFYILAQNAGISDRTGFQGLLQLLQPSLRTQQLSCQLRFAGTAAGNQQTTGDDNRGDGYPRELHCTSH